MREAKTFINLEVIVDIKNYRDSFAKWMKIRNKHSQDNSEHR